MDKCSSSIIAIFIGLMVLVTLFIFIEYRYDHRDATKERVDQIAQWVNEGYDIKTKVEKALEDDVINNFEYDDIEKEVIKQETNSELVKALEDDNISSQ